MRRVRVEVTADDIEKGVPRDFCWCPVARAVRRAFGVRRRYVFVDLACVVWQADDGDRLSGLTPAIAAHFIRSFDGGRPVKPFAFTLRVPE